ncbi:thioredoxin-like negative regulator of GroEL [Actinomadura coerulea]|uniref:Thioredoxin-like negative regulator of GroEL n=1 Tax=Actinomadura coerulea TaxID=46159 RepID=A0A7X0L164_9ACTN|nr:hypothetical protein [Actinomadura coerulea]MBB6398190.1 thioredoxin-like negative regulator of GroEL [Actinomadura coerulea]GGQ35739.1 hypothetical protein GCM10010187_61300 [Actinomadura coerulea]
MEEGLPSAVDPAGVHTPAELAEALKALARGRTVRAIEAASGLPGGRPRLSKSTVHALFDPATLCHQATLEIYLEAVGVPGGERDRWLDAWERARATSGAHGAVRVREAPWKILGVHEPIEVPGADPGVLPVYVPRDIDDEPGTGVRARLAAAAVSGGFVVLVGGSSSGKTRCLWEAVRAQLGQWWLRRPAGAKELAGWAADPPPRLVLWLDELQNHLGGGGLTAAVAERLVGGGCVLVGTLWPSYYKRYSAVPDAAFGAPGADPYEDERRTLALARIVRLPDRPTSGELRRARALAGGDDGSGGDGSGGDGHAVYSLAGWLAENGEVEQAIGMLRDRAGTDDGAVERLADLLVRRGEAEQAIGLLRDRADAIAPAMSSLTSHFLDLLAEQGKQEELRDRADAGDVSAARRLADLLAAKGDTQGLRDRAASGDRYAPGRLGDLLVERGEEGELRDRADAGDVHAADRLARWLAARGEVRTLRDRADAGDARAAKWLADLLVEHGDVEQALTVLRPLVDAADEDAATRMVSALHRSGRHREAERLWRLGLTAEGDIEHESAPNLLLRPGS